MNDTQIAWMKYRLELIKESGLKPNRKPLLIGQLDGALCMLDPDYRAKYKKDRMVTEKSFFPWCKPTVRKEDWAEKVVRIATEYVDEHKGLLG